jgi:leucyl/phenylalanyl-tRNA---protein transferase
VEIARLTLHNIFPDPNEATKEGIVAFGGDLSPSRIMQAYRNGIFPWYSQGDPILWWSPNPRLILELDDFRLHRSLKKSMKRFTYKFDTAFLDVVANCANMPRKDQDGTWILPEVIEAYGVLHTLGTAHSVEAYLEDELVGGAYGVVVGSVFCGESMFAKVSDASKAAFATLVAHLKRWGYGFIDCQVPTPHLQSLGAREVSREDFLDRLYAGRDKHISHRWEVGTS